MQKDTIMLSPSRPSLYRTHFSILFRLSAAAAAIAVLALSEASSFAGLGLGSEAGNGLIQYIANVVSAKN